jgi:hypothetical protein
LRATKEAWALASSLDGCWYARLAYCVVTSSILSIYLVSGANFLSVPDALDIIQDADCFVKRFGCLFLQQFRFLFALTFRSFFKALFGGARIIVTDCRWDVKLHFERKCSEQGSRNQTSWQGKTHSRSPRHGAISASEWLRTLLRRSLQTRGSGRAIGRCCYLW